MQSKGGNGSCCRFVNQCRPAAVDTDSLSVSFALRAGSERVSAPHLAAPCIAAGREPPVVARSHGCIGSGTGRQGRSRRRSGPAAPREPRPGFRCARADRGISWGEEPVRSACAQSGCQPCARDAECSSKEHRTQGTLQGACLAISPGACYACLTCLWAAALNAQASQSCQHLQPCARSTGTVLSCTVL